MTEDSIERAEVPMPARALLLIVGVAALLAGLYGRFKGIGLWPLGVDEFYLSRAVDNVLRTGLPGFPCGGYYNRGLAFQYVVAGLRLLGSSPEFAGRFAAGIASLAVLPAAYLLAKRFQGSLAGWLVAIILCASIWEIEMARFGRMYAPFQAVFAWYLLAYLRFTVDKNAAGLRWMIGLSTLGVLTWEGGVLLGLANIFAVLLLHENGRLTPKDWRRIALLSVLLIAFFLITRDIRGLTAPPAEDSVIEPPTSPFHFAALWLAPFWQHAAWACTLLIPVVLAIPAVRWTTSFRGSWLAFGGLCAALVAAAAHAFLLVASLLMLMLLMRIIDLRALGWQRARYFWLTLGAFFVIWALAGAADGLIAHGWTATSTLAETARQLFGFPNIYDHVLRPWLRTLPILSLGLFAAFVFLCWSSIISERKGVDGMSVLLSLVIVLVLAVGAIPTDRIETRYTFFLYSLLTVLAVCALLLIARRQEKLRHGSILVTASLPLLCFAATEDFQPSHILNVDSEAVNFRVNMPRHNAEHYYPRNDISGAARWLEANVRPGDVVITGIPNLDQYYRRIDFFYLDDTDPRYEATVCRDDRTERWTNRPLLYTVGELTPIVASGRRVFATLYGGTEQHLKDYGASVGWSVTRVWRADSKTADVVLIEALPAAAVRP